MPRSVELQSVQSMRVNHQHVYQRVSSLLCSINRRLLGIKSIGVVQSQKTHAHTHTDSSGKSAERLLVWCGLVWLYVSVETWKEDGKVVSKKRSLNNDVSARE